MRSFLQFLEAVSKFTVTIHGRTIPVGMDERNAKAGHRLAIVDTAAFDQAWRETGDGAFYVGVHGKNGIGDRYSKIDGWIRTADVLSASNAAVYPNGNVGFGDGRHRFAYLRDNGVTQIPISLSPQSIINARRFGLLAT